MLINNLLIPKLCFGGEVLGMSEKRMVPLKRILDNAIKCIVKKPNFCRLRAYQELDIDNIY